MINAVIASPKKTVNWIICLKNSLLTKVFHLTWSRSTTIASMRSKCSILGPKTIRWRADLVFSSPVSESMVSRYLGRFSIGLSTFYQNSKVLQWIGRAGNVSELPVDLSFNAGNMKKHIHPCQVGRHSQWSQSIFVSDIDSSTTLNCHVKHLYIVINYQDMSCSTSISILKHEPSLDVGNSYYFNKLLDHNFHPLQW